ESAEVRDAADAMREALQKYQIELAYRDDLYEAVQAYTASAEAKALAGEDARLLEWTLRDYRRAGFGLPMAEREQVKELFKKLVEIGIAFRRNIDTYEDAIWVTREGLAGLPDAYVDGLKSEERDGKTVYRVSLD